VFSGDSEKKNWTFGFIGAHLNRKSSIFDYIYLIYIYIYVHVIPRAPMTSIFEIHPQKKNKSKQGSFWVL